MSSDDSATPVIGVPVGARDDQVTEHFNSREWRCSDGTPYPSEWIADRLTPLCKDLEVLREAWGQPLHVTPHGGFRTLAVNEHQRGATHSRHLTGEAVDIAPAAVLGEHFAATCARLHDLALKLWGERKLPNIGGLGRYSQLCHLDIGNASYGHLRRWTGSGIGSELT